MGLRAQSFVVLTGFILVLTLASFLSLRFVVSERFLRLEREIADKSFHAIESLIQVTITALDEKLADWAAWDDTYAYAHRPFRAFEKSNFEANSMQTLKVNYALLVDIRGKVIWSGAYPSDRAVRLTLPESFAAHFKADSPFLKFEADRKSHIGVLSLKDGIVIFAARPIVTSDGEGPARGTLIFGQLLGPKEIAEIEEVSHQKLEIQAPILSQPSTEIAPPISHELRGNYLPHVLHQSKVFTDAYQQPIGELKVSLPRDVMTQGRTAIKTFGTLFSLLAFGFALLALILMDRIVLRRILDVERQVREIDDSKQFDRRIAIDKRDEITSLAQSFNNLLDRIAQNGTALEQVRQRLQLVIDSSSGGVWDWDLINNTVTFDNKWKTMLGYAPEEISDTLESFDKLMHPDDRERVWQEAKDFADGYLAHYAVKFRMLAKDGSYRWIFTEGQVVRDAHRKATRMIGWHRDITEQVFQESLMEKQRLQLIQSSKLSSLGEMAGGVAHEINNPLAIIQGVAGQIEARLNQGTLETEKLKKYSRTISDTVDRIAKIVRSMRSLARDGAQDPKVETSLVAIFSETLALCQEKIRSHGIRLDFDPKDPDLSLWCRPSEMVQVFLNLLNNAVDAMLTNRVEDPWILISTRLYDDYIEVAVQNAGEPIAKHIQDRLFQPFFSTKDVGQGTGLGLSISRGLVENHQGLIFLDTKASSPRFVIHMPIHSVERTLSRV